MSGQRIIGVVLFVLAVVAYTVYNYVTGQTSLEMLIGSLLIMCIPLVNIIAILIRNRRNEE